MLLVLVFLFFIHSFKNFYSTSSSPLLLRGAPDSSSVKKNSFLQDPSGSECPTTQFFLKLCLYFESPVFVLHQPVHELLSRPSSFSLSPILPSSVASCLLVFYPLFLPCSNYIH